MESTHHLLGSCRSDTRGTIDSRLRLVIGTIIAGLGWAAFSALFHLWPPASIFMTFVLGPRHGDCRGPAH